MWLRPLPGILFCHEGELEGRSDSSESDFEKVSEATDQVTTAETSEELEQAKAEIRDEIDFLNEQNETAKEAHEESERRALEGELEILQAAWREAEEVASIADRLLIPDHIEDWIRKYKKKLAGDSSR